MSNELRADLTEIIAALRSDADALAHRVLVIDTLARHLQPMPGYPTHKESVMSMLREASDRTAVLKKHIGMLEAVPAEAT